MTSFLGGYKMESHESRALGSIKPESYDYRDQAKLVTKLVSDVSYMGQYMREMQKGIDSANENFVQQIGDLIADILTIISGNGPTGFDFGDLKYIFQAIGALFGFDEQTGIGAIFPVNLFSAAWHFMTTYVIPLDNFGQVLNDFLDNALATLLDIFGEVPIVGQALQQLAIWLTDIRDWANNAWTFITEKLQGLTQPIVDFIVDLVDRIKTAFGTATDTIWTYLKFIIDIFQNFANSITDFTDGLIENIWPAYGEIKDNILSWWTDLFGDQNIFHGQFNILTAIQSITNRILDFFGGELNIDLSTWKSAVNGIRTWWTNLFGDLNIFSPGFNGLDLIQGWFNATISLVSNILNIDLSGWQTSISNMMSLWTNIFGDLNIFGGGVGVVDIFEGIAENLRDFIYDILPFDEIGAWIRRIFIEPIISVFTGGGNKLDIASLGASVRQYITKSSPISVSQLFGKIPHTMLGVVPVSNISETSENLLDPQGGFDLSTSVEGAGEWSWDATEGYGTSTGSAKLTCDGGLHQLFTRVALPVSERDRLEVSAVIKTTGYSGSGTPFRLCVVPFIENSQQSTVVIDSSGEAADWAGLSGEYIVDDNVTSIFVSLEVLGNAISGTVNWDSVSVVKTGKMRQSLVDKLEDVWDRTTELIDDGLDINPFDADTPLFKIWSAFRIQHDSVIGANSTIEQLRNRLTILEGPTKAVAIDDFERTGNLTPQWSVTEIGSGDGNVQLDGHHAYWSPSVGLADDNYVLCRFLGGGNYGSEHSSTEYQYVTATVNSGPFKLSAASPAIDLLAMVADDNSSLIRARWDGKGNLYLHYLQDGTYYQLDSASTTVPGGGTVLALKVGFLENGTPSRIAVYQNSATKIDTTDGSYSVHSYRNSRGWGFGMYARGTPLLGQYGPGSLHQWTANDQ